MIEVKVPFIAYDPVSKMPVVFLKEQDGNKVIPIWIGPAEALSIGLALEHIKTQRPLTHDLVINLLNGLDASIIKVVVTTIKNDTYYARLYLKKDNSIIEVDARPSDSIALALRSECPIYAEEEVFEKGRAFTINEESDLENKFQKLKPEDFGKFSL